MRLIINAIPLLGEEGGISNYAWHIAKAIMAHPDCDVTLFYGYPSKKLAGASPNKTLLSSLKGMARHCAPLKRLAKKALPLAYKILNTVRPRRWDCYFEPNFALLPSIQADRVVLTAHDFSCFRNPQWHPRDRVRHMERNFWPSVSRASHIITGAECIRREASQIYGIPSERISVIPHGVDTTLFRPAPEEVKAALRAKYRLPPHFILHVGALEPRKNLVNLIKAHAALSPQVRRRFPLVFIGPPGWENEQILALIHHHAPHTILLGQVGLAELPGFYSLCDVFVYPSFYEGFGLPVLEAMACGRPVLASTAEALVELSGGAAIHIPPEDVSAMTAQLSQLLEDEPRREELSHASLQRAAAFSWERSAEHHWRLFKDLTLR